MPRRANVLVEVEDSARFESMEHGPKDLLQLPDVMRRLMKEDGVIPVAREHRLVEIHGEVADATSHARALRFFAGHVQGNDGAVEGIDAATHLPADQISFKSSGPASDAQRPLEPPSVEPIHEPVDRPARRRSADGLVDVLANGRIFHPRRVRRLDALAIPKALGSGHRLTLASQRRESLAGSAGVPPAASRALKLNPQESRSFSSS